MVFEAVTSFKPGPFEIVFVAHETTTDEIHTGKLEGEWPNLEHLPVTVVPIALMQPTTAFFLRDGEVKRISVCTRCIKSGRVVKPIRGAAAAS